MNYFCMEWRAERARESRGDGRAREREGTEARGERRERERIGGFWRLRRAPPRRDDERARGVAPRGAPRAVAGGVQGALSLTLVPIRPRRRGERRSLRTSSPGVSLRLPLAFNPDTPRRLSTPSDAFQLHPDFALYGPSTLSARRIGSPPSRRCSTRFRRTCGRRITARRDSATRARA